MANNKRKTLRHRERQGGIHARMQRLSGDLHRVYSLGVCLEAALCGSESDISPELRVLIKHGVTLEVDRMTFEARAIGSTSRAEI